MVYMFMETWQSASRENQDAEKEGVHMKQGYERLTQTMKYYEQVNDTIFRPDLPVIIRVDGRAFKNFTKGLKVPFDEVFREAMANTMLDMCAAVPDTILGYTFSDEISLIMFPSNVDEGSRWFGYNVRKMVSITASMATLFFNKRFGESIDNLRHKLISDHVTPLEERFKEYPSTYFDCLENKLWTALFDSRAFSLPMAELLPYLQYRQMDCVRNSVPAAARAEFGKSASLWDKKSIGDMVQMLKETQHPWEVYSSKEKYGLFCVKQPKNFTKKVNDQVVEFARNKWVLIEETPNLSQDKKGLINYLPEI